MKSNNTYLKSIAKKTGNDDTEGTHSDNYYLKRIEDKIGKGGGGGDFSGDYNDLYNKPFIPSDVKDLTDTDDTAFTPKSHTHTESEITNLGDYIEKSQTAGLVKNDGTIDTTSYISEQYTHPSEKQCNYAYTHPTAKQCNASIPSDVSDLTDTHNTAFTPKSHSHTTSDISNFPSTMPPSSHTHTMSDVSDLDTVEVTVNYIDGSSELLNLVSYVPGYTIQIEYLGTGLILTSTTDSNLTYTGISVNNIITIRNVKAGTYNLVDVDYHDITPVTITVDAGHTSFVVYDDTPL